MKKMLANYYDLALAGEFPAESEGVVTAKVGSLSAGEVLQLQAKLQGEKIEDVRFKVYGCGYAIACANQAANWLKGKSINELEGFSAQELIIKLELPENKYHCAFLVEEGVTQLGRSQLQK